MCATILELRNDIKYILSKSISRDYVDIILNATDINGENKFIDCVAEDVLESSQFDEDGSWNYDDIRFAISRKLIERFNLN